MFMGEDMMKDECLICKAPLVYLEIDELMECAICHRKESSKTRCVNGHYVCNDCHTAGLDTIVALCLSETSKNPVEIIEKMMALPYCHMHGPEHHVMVGAALLTAYMEIVPAQYRFLDDPEKLEEAEHRYGTIRRRIVLYRGESTKLDNGIEYLNVEDYLKSL